MPEELLDEVNKWMLSGLRYHLTMSPFSIIGGVDNLMRKAKGVPNKPFGGWVCGCLFWEF